MYDFLTETGAIISECTRHRYLLWRIWDAALPFLGFVMLNPSTADATNNDPTIRKCINIAKHNHFGGIYVANIFSIRTPHPDEIYKHNSPIGSETDVTLEHLLTLTEKVIFAWGRHGSYQGRGQSVATALCRLSTEVYVLGFNKDGTPKHPLYQKTTQPLLPYNPNTPK